MVNSAVSVQDIISRDIPICYKVAGYGLHGQVTIPSRGRDFIPTITYKELLGAILPHI